MVLSLYKISLDFIQLKIHRILEFMNILKNII
nr:MAG TPA: hypothetical protein [Caudoviricetes sp.]